MYKLQIGNFSSDPCSVQRDNKDGSFTSIPFDPSNTDYQEYLAWIEEGNVPLPPTQEN